MAKMAWRIVVTKIGMSSFMLPLNFEVSILYFFGLLILIIFGFHQYNRYKTEKVN